MTERLAPAARHTFAHDGRPIYQWDQTLDEVNVYVAAPPVSAKQLFCTIQPTRVAFGLQGNPPFLDVATVDAWGHEARSSVVQHNLFGACVAADCFWTLEDGELHITLSKMEKLRVISHTTQGLMWKAAFAGHEIDAVSAETDQKRLMLERFQSENPGFDFSGAEFSGACPDPRTFMGGVGYNNS